MPGSMDGRNKRKSDLRAALRDQLGHWAPGYQCWVVLMTSVGATPSLPPSPSPPISMLMIVLWLGGGWSDHRSQPTAQH